MVHIRHVLESQGLLKSHQLGPPDMAPMDAKATNGQHPTREARHLKVIWQSALEEVSALWDEYAATRTLRGEEPAWLQDEPLMLAVRQGLLEANKGGSGDPARCAIRLWREAWLKHLKETQIPDVRPPAAAPSVSAMFDSYKAAKKGGPK